MLIDTRMDASFEYPWTAFRWDVQAQIGIDARAKGGHRLPTAIQAMVQAGVQLVAGGWGRFRPAAWAVVEAGGARLDAFIEDPFAFSSNAAYGRGITLRYQNCKAVAFTPPNHELTP